MSRLDQPSLEPISAPDVATQTQSCDPRSDAFRLEEVTSSVFGCLVQSQSTEGRDIGQRARELAHIQTTSTTFRDSVASLMSEPGMADMRRLFDQRSVQKAITQLAGNDDHDCAAFRVALAELLRDKHDVGLDLQAICMRQPLDVSTKGAIMLEALAAKTDLRSLAVKHTAASPAELEHVFSALAAMHANNPELESLSLEIPRTPDNRDGSDPTMQPLGQLDALASLTKLTHLGLSGHQAGGTLVQALSLLTSLKSLDVGGNCLMDTHIAQLATLTKLTSLNITGNRTDTHPLTIALGTLAGSLNKLTSLNVSSTGRNRAASGSELLRAISRFADLTSLGLSGAWLKADDFRVLAALPKLATLNLMGCRLGPEYMTALAKLPNLIEVELSLTDVNASAINELAAHSNLRSLSIRDSRIDDAAAAALAELSTLTTLDISNNRCDDSVSQATRDALRAMPNMRRLLM